MARVAMLMMLSFGLALGCASTKIDGNITEEEMDEYCKNLEDTPRVVKKRSLRKISDAMREYCDNRKEEEVGAP